MATGDVTLQFISAPSPKELVRVCFINNSTRGKQLVYHSITYANGTWYAWFHDDISSVEISNLYNTPEKIIKKKVSK